MNCDSGFLKVEAILKSKLACRILYLFNCWPELATEFKSG